MISDLEREVKLMQNKLRECEEELGEAKNESKSLGVALNKEQDVKRNLEKQIVDLE